jgi:plasmid stability protein
MTPKSTKIKDKDLPTNRATGIFIRLPQPLVDRLRARATYNLRTLSAEARLILTQSLDAEEE